MRYELTDLRLFLAIAEAGSLTEGAAVVHLTSSAASYRLKNLENALGTALFVRLARGMELTAAGQVVNKYAREMMAQLSFMHSEVSQFSSGIKGSVKLLANSSSFNGYVIPAISRFLALHPDINVTLEERPSDVIVQAIVSQEADIGVLAGPVITDTVNATFYATDELVLITALHHPLLQHKQLRFEALLTLDFVSTSRDQSHSIFLRQTAQKYGKTLNVRLYTQNFHAVIELVKEGVGVAVVPYSVVQTAIAENKIACIKIDEPWAKRSLYMVTPNQAERPQFVQVLLDFLLSQPK